MPILIIGPDAEKVRASLLYVAQLVEVVEIQEPAKVVQETVKEVQELIYVLKEQEYTECILEDLNAWGKYIVKSKCRLDIHLGLEDGEVCNGLIPDLLTLLRCSLHPI